MISAAPPKNEYDRLKKLDSLSILDTIEEEDYDNLTAIASEICGTPIGLVSLIDEKRQWFKSHHGLPVSETPREFAFCAHAINNPEEVLIVPDSRLDERFHDNPLVTDQPEVIFYAGVPLVTEGGMALGTLCVIDHKPRELTQGQLKSLVALSGQVVNLLKLRKREIQLEKVIEELTSKNDELDKFAFIAAHDLSSPLKNINSLTRIFVENYSDELEPEATKILELIAHSSEKLRELVEGLLNYSRNDSILQDVKTTVKIDDLKNYVKSLFASFPNAHFQWNSQLKSIYTNKTALHQILINLVSNALKHGDKEIVQIEIGVSEKDRYYQLYIKDNGPGIDQKYHDRIFDIFATLANNARTKVTSSGIGLATVKKLVKSLGGEIHVESELGLGATFHLSIKK